PGRRGRAPWRRHAARAAARRLARPRVRARAPRRAADPAGGQRGLTRARRVRPCLPWRVGGAHYGRAMTTPHPTPYRPAAEPPPGTPGSARPPRWLPRALVMAVVAVFLGIFVWNAMGALEGLFVNVLIAVFIALALEPPTVWLVRQGWRRGLAAAPTLLGSLLVLIALAPEPPPCGLVRQGWRRGRAAATTLLGSLVVVVVLIVLVGNLFVHQVVALAQFVPRLYAGLQTFVAERFDIVVPSSDNLL